MPGLVFASRRWIIGSDDFIIPGSLLLTTHLIWIATYAGVSIKNGTPFLTLNCSNQLVYHVFGQFVLIIGCAIIELCIVKVSLRGSILNTNARQSLVILLYIRLVMFFIEVLWEIYGLTILIYDPTLNCGLKTKELIIGLKIFDLFIWISLLLLMWCAFDSAGKSWVKMKKFEESLRDPNAKYRYRRSKNSSRNWRHREAVREYERSWHNRFRKFCCIVNLKDRRENSFADIAKLLSEFFRDLDVVPSDVIAGLSLMRVQQKAGRHEAIADPEQEAFQFLSGVPVTSETMFLDLTHPLVVKEVFNLIHYLHYSLAIYGWPMYMVANAPSQWCKLLKHIKCCGNQSSGWLCCCFCCSSSAPVPTQGLGPETVVEGSPSMDNLSGDDFIIGDNCCLCNRAAIQQTCIDHNYKIIYITYQVAMEKPPFFVAVDYDKMSIVVSIRGTLSLYDVLTDLNAEYDILPMNPSRENWFGHKGMVAAASYIRSKLVDKHILEMANEELKSKLPNSCSNYPIVIVGHSLGAGTAAILAVLLRELYRNVVCFAFAPPGGLLSEEAATYSKDFVISLVLGKDIVPRLGLHQMEKLRFDLIKSIKQCDMTKWGIIFKSCCLGKKDISNQDFIKEFNVEQGGIAKVFGEDEFKNLSIHPNDESISLTVHTPLYPPGSIIHLVRMHPNKSEQLIARKQPIIQALWADNKDFNEILISPTMIKDHMPDHMLEALQSLLTTTGPPKPQRQSEANNRSQSNSSSNESESSRGGVVVETSFADSHKATDRSELLTENRLKRLRSLVCKGRAPLASPETISLASNIGESRNTHRQAKDEFVEISLETQPLQEVVLAQEVSPDSEERDYFTEMNALTFTHLPSLATKKLNKSSSDSNLQRDGDIKYGHLKRSHEKYHLNNLDSSTTVYDENN